MTLFKKTNKIKPNQLKEIKNLIKYSQNMTKKLKILISTALVLTYVNVLSKHKLKGTRPNIIVIIGDDISSADIGCYENKGIKTPNIDKLAENGMKFTNAFLTAASCSPSRASIFTGRWPHSNGQTDLATGALPSINEPWPKFFDGIDFFPEILKESGYYCAQSGKWHIGYHHAKPSGPALKGFHFTERSKGRGGEERWINTLQNRPKDKPFFMWFAANDAHRGWSGEKRTKPEDVFVPPFLPDTDFVRKDLAKYYDEIIRLDSYVGKVVEELKRQNAYDNTVIIFMADNGRPFWRSKAQIYDSGMRTPFIVQWPGKVKNNQISKSIVSAVDLAPTFIELAGMSAEDYTFQGNSFKKILKDPESQTNRYVFSERNWHGYASHQRSVRDTEGFMYIRNAHPEWSNHGTVDYVKYMTPLYKQGKLTKDQADLFRFPREAEELYDRNNDPHQLNNLILDPKYKRKLKKLRKVMDKWQKLTGDSVAENFVPDWYKRPGMDIVPRREWGIAPGIRNYNIGKEKKVRKLTSN